jgi:hypothetical protein
MMRRPSCDNAVAWTPGTLILALTVWLTVAQAHDGPITGIVRAVDAEAMTVTVRSTGTDTTGEVLIHVRADTKVVRFTRAASRKFSYVEQPATLADLTPGWTVSVTTAHEGEKEVARLIRMLHEP